MVVAVSIFLNYAAITAGTEKCPRMKSFLEMGNFSTFPTHRLLSWIDPLEVYIISREETFGVFNSTCFQFGR